jgi:hypothetical protein
MPPASVPPWAAGASGTPASLRVEATTPGGDVLPLAITLGLVAVLRRADASLVPFGNP